MQLEQWQIEKFWSKVDRSGDCWISLIVARDGAAGGVQIGGVTKRAHAWAYFIATGIDPKDHQIFRSCHNRLCVRPEHLYAKLAPRTTDAKLAHYVSKTDTCWLWTGPKDKRGYGVVAHGYNHHGLAHRAMWESLHGPIPKGLYILHSCDNTSCVNPDHLRLGSAKDNSQDMATKGRAAFGERNARSKLTTAQIVEIRRRWTLRQVSAAGRSSWTDPNSGAALAKEFGVTQQTISKIVRGQRWADIA